ncbi:MAG TPA: hypothetical protein VE685_01725 [Thermoanaerobaculia bacterium]|nr:hypothetical protein [Thermoanaerobaculia bacterium]
MTHKLLILPHNKASAIPRWNDMQQLRDEMPHRYLNVAHKINAKRHCKDKMTHINGEVPHGSLVLRCLLLAMPHRKDFRAERQGCLPQNELFVRHFAVQMPQKQVDLPRKPPERVCAGP